MSSIQEADEMKKLLSSELIKKGVSEEVKNGDVAERKGSTEFIIEDESFPEIRIITGAY